VAAWSQREWRNYLQSVTGLRGFCRPGHSFLFSTSILHTCASTCACFCTMATVYRGRQKGADKLRDGKKVTTKNASNLSWKSEQCFFSREYSKKRDLSYRWVLLLDCEIFAKSWHHSMLSFSRESNLLISVVQFRIQFSFRMDEIYFMTYENIPGRILWRYVTLCHRS